MSSTIGILSRQLNAQECEEAHRLLCESFPESRCLIHSSLAEEAQLGLETYTDLPDPKEWRSQRVDRVIFFGSDPRLFTAPRFMVPSSRPLETVSFEVARELVGFFSDQLHPGFIQALAETNTPLQLTGFNGTTLVEHPSGAPAPLVSSIVAKRGVILLSVSTPAMWHQSGFLAKIFQACADLEVSVDQVSASESEVTLTLDTDREQTSPATLDELMRRLAKLGQVALEEPCAAVTLVGQRIRSILTQLSSVLGRFEEERVFLISQSASDCNLTFVVEQDKANKLVRDLHARLFPSSGEELSSESAGARYEAWWVTQREALLKMSRHQKTPFFLLHQPTVERQVDVLLSTSGCDRLLFAIKSNHHPDLLRAVRARGVRFECVSPEEIDHLFALFPDMTGEEILYTPNFASALDFQIGFDRGAYVTLDNHSPLEDHPELFSGRSLVLRIDPGRGEGHHKHVKTAGRGSKFGIDLEMLPRTRDRLVQLDCKVIGLHCHAGSGIRSVRPWVRNANVLEGLLPMFPEARFLDLGGGFGVPERPGESPLDLSQLQGDLKAIKKRHPQLEIWLEPGRFIVAQAGVLLTRVTQVKKKGDQIFVGVDAGMNSLIRPALYGAYHPLVNLSRYHDPYTVKADVVGPICESGDVLGSQRILPESRPGDLFLVGNTGAYGRVMSSRYNMREPAPELWWTGGKESSKSQKKRLPQS